MARPILRVARAIVPALVLLALSAPPASADCPGGSPACVYTASSQIGQRSGGVLRFPQAISIGPDGSVFVGDQGSHVVQVFAPDGSFRREVGVAGNRRGELTSVGAVAAVADGSVIVADGTNRLQRFGVDGSVLNAWGRPGNGVGEFHFGAGGGNDAGAGGGLAVAGDMVYVADSGNDRIQRFTLDGGHGAVIVPPGQLAFPKGLSVRKTRLAVADDQHHRIVVYDTGGKVLKVVGAGPGRKPGQLNAPYGVALDSAGRLFVADDLNHRVVRYSGAPNYPYKGRWGSYGNSRGQLAYPRSLATDALGNVYVANTGNDRVDVFDRGGTLLRSFGSSGRATGQFDAPAGVAADISGIRAVADSINGRVEFLNPDGSIATVWGSPAPGPTILPRPVAVAFDAAGNAYVLDQRRARIVVFSRTTGLQMRTIATQGTGPGQLLEPSALAIAGTTISVADGGNRRIARFTTAGDYLGATTGVGKGRGIAVTPDGSRTYLATTNNRITVYGPTGSELDDFGGDGSALGKLNAPAQLALDGVGNLWVADKGNNRVQQFGPGGERLATFGQRGIGPGQFIHPTGVSVDCHGLVTVTDTDNNRVQQFLLAAPAPVACAPLPALGSPPAPKLPTLPTPDGPQIGFRVLRSTRLLTARSVPIRVGCDTACTLVASGSVSQAGKPRKGHKRATVALATTKLQIAAGDTEIVRLTLTRRQMATLRRALRGLRGLSVTLQVTATASVGQPTEQSKRLKATS